MNRQNSEQAGGISALDLGDLPANQRKTMRLMLRRREIAYLELCQVMEALPEADRLSRSELDEALQSLSEQQWLIRSEAEPVTYKINFRRKAGKEFGDMTSRQRMRRTLARGIWNVLDSVETQPAKLSEKIDPENSER